MKIKLLYKAYFDILNQLGMTHKCDRQVDGRTDIPVLCLTKLCGEISIASQQLISRWIQQQCFTAVSLLLFSC